MSILNKIGIAVGLTNNAANIFEGLFENFTKLKYKKPSEYITIYWNYYLKYTQKKIVNNNTNGKVFEYILATLFIRENLLPLFLSAKVAFVPNVIYDILLYTKEKGPVIISAKTSLRERYKQADLEAIALKYVHRKALSYLITLEKSEANSVKNKIKNGDVIGLDDVIVATESEFDDLIVSLRALEFSDPPTVKVINASQIITKEIISNLLKK